MIHYENMIVTGSIEVTGSVTADIFTATKAFIGAISGSITDAEYAISSSHAVTASNILPLNQNVDVNGNLTITGTLTAKEFNTEYITGSVIYESGSTKFGDTLDDKHEFTGSVEVLGGITGSLLGSASYAVSSSNTLSASYAESGSYTLSSSYSTTSSYAESSSFSHSGSFAVTASYSVSSSQAESSSVAISSSYALSSSQAESSSMAISSSYALSSSLAESSSYALSSSYSVSSSQAESSSMAVSSSYSLSSSFAISSSLSVSSSFAVSSSRAVTSSFAISSSLAVSSSFAVSSSRAVTSSLALDLVSSVYTRELHVSQQSGNDSGSGTLLKPFATIERALSVATSGNQIVIHPGTYSPTASLSFPTNANNISIVGANSEIGGLVNIAGTFNMNQNIGSVRMVGLTMQGITISGSSNVYIKDSTISTSGIVKTGGGYLEIDRISCEFPTPFTITGAGSVVVTNSKLGAITVNNAAAVVNLQGNLQVVTPAVTAGTMLIDGGVVYSLTNTTPALTAGVNATVLVKDAMLLTPSSTNARITLSTGSFASIQNSTYDKANSVTGRSLNNTAQFQAINADALSGSFANIPSITGSLFGTASWSRNSLTASFVSTASLAHSASYVNLTAGPNITINLVSGSYVISGSANGGGAFSGSALTLSGSDESSITMANISGSYKLLSYYNNTPRWETSTFRLQNQDGEGMLEGNKDRLEFFPITSSFEYTKVLAPDLTGSLFGTASWSENSLTASFVESSSYALTASYVESSSYALSSSVAESSSFSFSSSYSENAMTASLLLGSVESASYAENAASASWLPISAGDNIAIEVISGSYEISVSGSVGGQTLNTKTLSSTSMNYIGDQYARSVEITYNILGPLGCKSGKFHASVWSGSVNSYDIGITDLGQELPGLEAINNGGEIIVQIPTYPDDNHKISWYSATF
jgi:hypothetical protein